MKTRKRFFLYKKIKQKKQMKKAEENKIDEKICKAR